VLNFKDTARAVPVPGIQRTQPGSAQRGNHSDATTVVRESGFPGATQLIANALGSLVVKGDLSDTLQALNGAGLLANNVDCPGSFPQCLHRQLRFVQLQRHVVTLRRRLSQGLQFDFNYTFSRSIDNVSSVANTVIGGLVAMPQLQSVPRALRLRRHSFLHCQRRVRSAVGREECSAGTLTRLEYAHRRLATFRYLYRALVLPSAPQRELSLSVSYLTVRQFSPVELSFGYHIHNDGGQIQYFADPTTTLGALSNPFGGEIGNRNNLRGPSFVNFDLGVAKRFQMPCRKAMPFNSGQMLSTLSTIRTFPIRLRISIRLRLGRSLHRQMTTA